ncbi:MAG TPA: 5-oxoprolinase subunit PxpB [Clostridia bacterium]|nr:5-oxoprolinase subunit PxpB [Clostridia bacterium]
MYSETRYLLAGDSGIVVEFADEVSLEVSVRVRSMTLGIERARIPGVVECVPSYRSILVVYDPLTASPESVEESLRLVEAGLAGLDLPPPAVIEIPTAYGGEHGPDLRDVAAHSGLSEEEVIRIHSGVDYLVYMIGFHMGFPYLGGMDERIAMPRLKTPRTLVPAGSIGIAGAQTGIYPVDSPGGWRIIGRTPVRIFDPYAEPPALLKAGDYVRFVPITHEEFALLQARDRKREHPRTYSATDMTALAAPAGARLAAGAGTAVEDVLEVLDPGLFTTVQDWGRPGYLRYGVPPSGAMDRYSLAAANALVGNEPWAPALEMTLTGPVLRCLRPIIVAVAGAGFLPVINGKPVGAWESIQLNEGDVLGFVPPSAGCRAYLAVSSGGIAVPPVMGSSSTYTRGHLGGIEGRRLKVGDRLPVRLTGGRSASNGAAVTRVSGGAGLRLPEGLRRVPGREWRIRAIPGPQDDYFTARGLETFFSEEYSVTQSCDRMGIRLSGAAIEHRGKQEIISDGVPAGAVQVPGEGQPIILLADRQSTGGYPKIATVISADLDLLGQVRPGDIIKFERIGLEQAHRVLREYTTRIQSIPRTLEGGAATPGKGAKARTFVIHVAGRTFTVKVEELP